MPTMHADRCQLSHGKCCMCTHMFRAQAGRWMAVSVGWLPQFGPNTSCFLHYACPPNLRCTNLCSVVALPQVHKFGGTCVAAAERIEAICKYLVEQGSSGPADAKQVGAVMHAVSRVLSCSCWGVMDACRCAVGRRCMPRRCKHVLAVDRRIMGAGLQFLPCIAVHHYLSTCWGCGCCPPHTGCHPAAA